MTWERVRYVLMGALIFTFGLTLALVMQSREQADTVQIIARRQTGAIVDIEQIEANQREILANQQRIIELLENQNEEPTP